MVGDNRMDNGINVGSLESNTIDLYGTFGKFYVGDKKIIVHYFLTYASPSANAEGGHNELLKQLAPMRERVPGKDIKDLDVILQRDLSDERIASDLIPYLEGKTSSTGIGFFPAILAVLMPKDFIQSNPVSGSVISYPKLVETRENESDYENFWSLELHQASSSTGKKNTTRLGTLKINNSKSSVIVIDGQHRANAFRYASKGYDPEDMYKNFYKEVKPIDNYNAELPVTLIWFESKSGYKIQPTDISKELFVAVNNNARAVSKARTILLDENDMVSLGVNSYYRFLAKNRGFKPGKMNLLTSGFDLDDSISQAHQPKMVLTNPDILYKAFVYAFFANSGYDKLKDKATKARQNNDDRFKEIFGTKSYYTQIEGVFKIKSRADKDKFRDDFERKYLQCLNMMFEANEIVKVHFEANKQLDECIRETPNPDDETCWENIFNGGEGLYSAYMSSKLKACRASKKRIKIINNNFSNIRLKHFNKNVSKKATLDQVEQCYESFNTIAFQTGFLLTIDYIAKIFYSSNFKDAEKALKQKISEISNEIWVVFFNEFRDLYIGELDPNSWPKIERMLLLLLSKHYEIFEKENDNLRPEFSIIDSNVKVKLDTHLENMGKKPDDKERETIIEKIISEINSVVKKLGVKLLNKKTLKKYAETIEQGWLELHQDK